MWFYSYESQRRKQWVGWDINAVAWKHHKREPLAWCWALPWKESWLAVVSQFSQRWAVKDNPSSSIQPVFHPPLQPLLTGNRDTRKKSTTIFAISLAMARIQGEHNGNVLHTVTFIYLGWLKVQQCCVSVQDSSFTTLKPLWIWSFPDSMGLEYRQYL